MGRLMGRGLLWMGGEGRSCDGAKVDERAAWGWVEDVL